MTLMEAIEKFRERAESSPAFLEMKEKLVAQTAQKAAKEAELKEQTTFKFMKQ